MLVCLILLLGLAVPPMSRAQEAQAAAPAVAPVAVPKSEIFSGNVTELTTEWVVVVRKVWGKDAETRKFLLDGQTRVEGMLKVKARVTVQFRVGAEEPVPAVHIIVR